VIVQNEIIDVTRLDKHDIEFLFDQCLDLLALFGAEYDLEECKMEMDRIIEKCAIPFNQGMIQ
jgi:hypothetical protein